MSREKRLIVSLVAIGAVGIGALVALRSHLGSRLPQRSVSELPKAASPAPDLPAAPAAAPAKATLKTPAQLADGFLAARKAASTLIARYPMKFKKTEAELTGNYESMKGVRTGVEVDTMAAYKVERFEALQAAGLTQDDYESVKTAWRVWKSGGSVAPGLAAAFDPRRKALMDADLGPLEKLDDLVR